jgi:hypothetical protein
MRTSAVAAAMTAILLAACSDADVSSERESWTISAVPSTSIGAASGDSAYLFQRIADARFIADGRIVVADGGLLVLREYDRNGAFIAQMGGKGSGPGEFQSLRDIWILAPDTVVAWDSRAQRLTWFGGDRTTVRTVTLRPAKDTAGAARPDFLAGALRDGSLVLGGVTLAAESGPDRVSIDNFGQNGEHLRRLGGTTGLVRARLAEKINGPLPFSPFPHAATDGVVVYHTNGAEPVVTAWSASEERTIAFPPHDYDVEREWSTFVAKLEGDNVQPFVRVVTTAPRPEAIPHLAGLLVDEAGHLWAKRYDPRTDAIWLGGGARGFGGTWWVADPARGVIARVAVPDGFAPLQVAGARVLGVSVDSLGVERVEIRAISK